jgi:hypothetical protein
MKKLLISAILFLAIAGSSLSALDSKFITVIYQAQTPVADHIRVWDEYAYIFDDWQLYVYNLKNNWKPFVETAFSSSFPITDIELLDYNHIYVCSHEPTNYVAEIDSLNLYGRIFVMERLTCNKARREGALLFTSHLENGLEIYDISKGIIPQRIVSFSENWGIVDLETRYPVIHALNEFGYLYLDVMDVSNPKTVGFNYEIVGGTVLSINRNIAWIGAGSTLYAVEYTYPEKPTIINRYRFSSDIFDLKARDNELFVGLRSGGLKILNISNPKRITEKNSFYLKTGIYSVFVDGDYLYLGAGNQGWYILEYR